MKSPSFKVIACSVLEFGAIYWAGGGKHLPPVLIGLSLCETGQHYLANTTIFSELIAMDKKVTPDVY